MTDDLQFIAKLSDDENGYQVMRAYDVRWCRRHRVTCRNIQMRATSGWALLR